MNDNVILHGGLLAELQSELNESASPEVPVVETAVVMTTSEEVEAGESAVEEVKLIQVETKKPPVRIKKHELAISFRRGHVFEPPAVAFIGVGKFSTKYDRWLASRFASSFDIINNTLESAEPSRQLVKAKNFIQSLVYLAVAEQEVEKLSYVLGSNVGKDLDIANSVRQFVQANIATLLPLASYFRIHPDMINPQPAVEEVQVAQESLKIEEEFPA